MYFYIMDNLNSFLSNLPDIQIFHGGHPDGIAMDPRAFNTFHGDGCFDGVINCAKGENMFDRPVTYPDEINPAAPSGRKIIVKDLI
jgi:hypothetical protein